MLAVSVARPLASLQASARAVASGDLEARARVSGPEEVASLARDFNEMVTARQRADEALKKAQEDLEARIQQRTRELLDKNQELLSEISERKRAEEGLRESEEKYRDLVENISEIIYSLDKDGRITYVSPVVKQIGGYSPSEVIGRSFTEFIHPDDLAPLIESFQRTVSGNLEPSEYRLFTKSGEIRWARTSSRPILDGDRIVGLRAVLMDITDRKQAEEALRETDQRYRTLFDRSLDAVYVHDLEGRFLDANDAALRLLGYSRDEISKLSFADLLDDSQLPVALAALEEIIKTGTQAGLSTYKLERKDGTFAEVETHAAAVYEGGRPVAVQGMARDVTERKRAEEALRESEAKYRQIFENVQDIYYQTDANGIIIEINPTVEKYGYTREELIGTQVLDVYESPEERSALLKVLLERGEVVDYEVHLKTGDGRVVDTSVSAHFLRGPDGASVGVEGSLRDISERKRLEEALRDQVRRDPLTGVLNHATIVEELRNLVSDGGDGASHVAAMIDVDDLKVINDTYGHQVGDAVLVAVAGALSRDGAVVGRYGGDEFVAILAGADRDAGERYRDAVLDTLAGAPLTDPETGASVAIAVSIGLATCPTEAGRIEELIKLADSDMYAAKRQRPVRSAGMALPRLLGDERAAKMVGEIVPLLTSPGDLNEKLRLVAHRLSVGAGYDAVNFGLFPPAQPEAPFAAETFAQAPKELVEAWNREQRRARDVPLRQILERTRRPIILDDLLRDQRLTDTQRELVCAAGLRSALVAPMIWQNELIGDVSVASKRKAAFGPRDAQFLMAVATQVTAIARMATLVEELQSASARLTEAQAETVMLLAAAAEAHDRTSGHHLQNVRATTEALAAELGYSEKDARELGLAAVLHDIGKIRVPDSILANVGRLSDEEWELMKGHTVWGGEFLAGRLGFELAAAIARSHHERWDGSGYPDGLSGEAIPEPATIVSVADAFDAMTSGRPYRAARSIAQAVRGIVECSSTQFSPRVVQALVRLRERNEPPLADTEDSDQKAAA